MTVPLPCLQGVAPYLISPLEGLQKIPGLTVTYAQGCDVSCDSTSGFGDAVDLAEKADVTVVVIGLTTAQERLSVVHVHSHYDVRK